MLLDLTLSSCGKYVITCDRDEKIRVSHFPNSYNISNFCLGHTEFVAGLAICPHRPSLLCSASGDGTLRIWDFLNGLELDSKLCSLDLPESLQSVPEIERFESTDPAKNGGSNAVRVKRSSTPGLKSIRCRQVSDDQTLVVVHIEK
jgi:WD40 repeat protein